MDLSRAFRVMHGALVAGLVVLGVTAIFALRVLGHPFGAYERLGLPLALVSLVLFALAVTVLRRQIGERRADQSPADYWSATGNGSRTLFLWCSLEAAALLAWVAYLVAGMIATMVLALAATLALLLFRPGRLEGERVA